LKRCILRSRRRVGWCEFSADCSRVNPGRGEPTIRFRTLPRRKTQLVGHKPIGREALFLEQLALQFHRHSFIAPPLHEQVENLAFVVSRLAV
jgi:hypothetical protein